ncbi:unnamed protein product [Hanseniaspora opuntiae]
MEKDLSDHLKRSRMTISPVSGKLELTDDQVNDPYRDSSARPFHSLDQVIKKQKQNEKEKSLSTGVVLSDLLSNNQLGSENGGSHYKDISLDEEVSSEDSNSILVGSRSVPKVMIKFKKGKIWSICQCSCTKGMRSNFTAFYG